MKIRHLLRALLLFLASALNAQDTAPRPNILFIFADDWGRYASCYAGLDGRPSINDVVKTPNIDRVARHGVLFRHAFVPAPSCTPCRSSLLTGRYFFQTGMGAILQGAKWDATIPSWPHLLRDGGYHIGETSKVWSPGTPGDAPFGAGKHAFEKAGGAYNQFSQAVTKAIAAGESPEAAKERLYSQVRANFRAFLDARPDDAPFAYWFGPTNVHRKWVKDSGKALWGIDPDALKGKLPAFLPDVHPIREDIASYLGEIHALDAMIGVLLTELEKTGMAANTLILISGDHGMPGMPRGKCNLYDFGTAVPLIAAGPGIPPGRIVDDFVNLMDITPTLCEAAAVPAPAGIPARSFLGVLRSSKTGLVDPTRTHVVTGRERHVGFARENNLPYPQRAIRTATHLYIRNFAPDRWPMGTPDGITDTSTPPAEALTEETYTAFADMDASPTKAWLIHHRNDPGIMPLYELAFAKRPAEELYDLAADPDQIRNLATDPAHAETKKQLSAQLIKILTDARDPRTTGDGTAFDREPYTVDTRPGKKK